MDFLLSQPSLDLLLSCDRPRDVIELLEINQAMNFVLGSEFGSDSGSMLLDPSLEIVRHSGIKSVGAIRQDIDEIVFAHLGGIDRSAMPHAVESLRVGPSGRPSG